MLVTNLLAYTLHNMEILHEYGSEFFKFLTEFEPVKNLSYLPDMAKFEWSYHRVFHEADAQELDLQRLQIIDEQEYEKIIFTLHPATRLLESRFPLIDIWQANQSDDPPEINLETNDYFFLIGRRDYENVFQNLNQIEYQFLNMIQKSKTLGEITTFLTGLQSDKKIDLNSLLIRNVTLGNICDFELA